MSAHASAPESITVRAFAQRFSATRRGARLARYLTLQQLDAWGVPYGSEPSDDIASVVGELAANAVLHGRVPGRDFALVLRFGGDHVRVEVTDARTGGRPTAPGQLVAPADESESGRGLLLVSALASRWGITDNAPAPGKTVWAEIGLR
ncbi:ATP-binding protein [Streptomyces sp. WMMB 322]|uniref:ATP-binding protein n=1 Tax=Streptomyces sp. WMMB 322 TaxID=1286821 RepID=UPI0006E21AE0|nr:ATP-binding protein [Streptomyces sp. WMMB 322]SCK42467.1 Anti-sigma regulatory factor (Ser/Thr protein kinase) [Streptomyces sp. WMMB 322]